MVVLLKNKKNLQDLNLQLLSVATSQSCGSKWAWLRLGLHYLSINKQQEAVNSLRAAVRLDPNDKYVGLFD